MSRKRVPVEQPKKRKKRPTLKSTAKWVQQACEDMTKHLVARRARGVSDIRQPSGKASLTQWIEYYGQLRALIWSEAGPTERVDAAEEAMLAALLDEPTEVRLLSGKVVHVYPKGLDSLMWFRHHDWLMGWLGPRVYALQEDLNNGDGTREELPKPVTVLDKAESELGYQLGMFCAEATTPGAAKGPWASSVTVGKPLPEEWRDVDPHDIAAVHRGFVEVNASRLQALEQIVRPQRGNGEGGMSWNVFMATMGTRLQVDPASLAKNRSLVSLLATVRLSREAEPEPAT